MPNHEHDFLFLILSSDQLRLGVILVNTPLDTQLVFMNHFPLFALMLRAKDP
jgi:hypothetical protein